MCVHCTVQSVCHHWKVTNCPITMGVELFFLREEKKEKKNYMYNSESIYVIKKNSWRNAAIFNAAIFNDVVSGFKQIVVSLLWGIVGSP